MTNWIDIPYGAHIVADVDDADFARDVASRAWARRRNTTRPGPGQMLMAHVRRALMRIRLAPATALLLLALVAIACSDASAPPPPDEPVVSVSVTPATRTLVPGETAQLTAIARGGAGQELPGRSITWSSSSAAVATVSNRGLVTAVAPGEATVSALVEGVAASAVIHVATPGGIVDHVELDVATLAMQEGGTRQLSATARDATGNVVAGRVVQWTSTDPEVATVGADGTVTGVRSGTAIVRAKVDGKIAEATVRITTPLAYDLVFEAWEQFVGSEVFYQDVRDVQAPSRRLFIPGRWATDPAPSPNGTRVAFVVTPYSGNTDLFIGSVDGAPFVRLTEGGPQDDQPAWSPDGRQIVFRRYTPGSPDTGSDVWVIDVETRIPNNLTPDQQGVGQGSPAWSPDGTRIAYTHTNGSTSHIWTMRADGSDKRQVTTGDVYDDQPAWSPDGTTLAFTRSAVGIFGDVFLVNADGGNARKLMPFVDLAFDQFAPAWSPDGRMIAFTSKHEGGAYQVYTVWADGSKLARRTSGSMNKESPAWIPREVIIRYQSLTRE